jgi:hypothetical protein
MVHMKQGHTPMVKPDRSSIYIDRDIHRQARVVAALQGRPLARFIEEAVKEKLATIQTIVISAPADQPEPAANNS